jgi:hypothetical protein
MVQAMRTSMLLVAAVAFGSLHAGEQTRTLSLKQSMTAEQFERAGLHKLTSEELVALERWIATDALLRVAGVKTLDSPLSTDAVIESQIDGEFEGWEGDTIFRLMNGQIWQQISYAYTYHYAYSPRVTIYRSGAGYQMIVEGVNGKISVKRIK